jgi:hypothetical protein
MNNDFKAELEQRIRDALAAREAHYLDEFFALNDARSKAYKAFLEADSALNDHFVDCATASATFGTLRELYQHLYGDFDPLAPTISDGEKE